MLSSYLVNPGLYEISLVLLTRKGEEEEHETIFSKTPQGFGGSTLEAQLGLEWANLWADILVDTYAHVHSLAGTVP